MSSSRSSTARSPPSTACLPVRDRTLRLVNHADTVERTPVAMRANFAAAVRAVGRKMDRDEDVLLLFMTSHGIDDGIALGCPA